MGTGAALLFTLLLAGAQAAQAPAAAADPPGDVENGRRVYNATGCYQCHGREGQGSPVTGPRLGPSPRPFAPFAAYVRRPTGQMPPYTAKVLSDKDLADIHAFLRARPRPASPPPLSR